MYRFYVELTFLILAIVVSAALKCSVPAESCLNGGTCEPSSGGDGECRCLSDYVGDRCQFPSPCSPSPCHNGGECRIVSHGNAFDFSCVCRPGFIGSRCLVPSACPTSGKDCHKADPCASNPCANSGQCSVVDSTFNCSCLPSFTGPRCEVNVGDCLSHSCQNGGICVDGVNGYSCQCPPNFTGQYCTENVNECELMPSVCKNRGTCHDTHGGYTCVCVNGWTGEDCSENIDDCASAACFKGATCIDRVASFVCLCPVGRTGLLCQLPDACLSNPCPEGSNCDTNPLTGRPICFGYSALD